MSAVKRIGLVATTLVIAGFAAWTLRYAPPLPQGAKADLVVVHKAARRLELYQQGALLKAYAVSLGRHSYGNKQQQGDGRTPEGDDVGGFRRVFRKIVGLTPSEYRHRFCRITRKPSLEEKAS